MKHWWFFLCISVLIQIPISVGAVGVGVEPAGLNFNINSNGQSINTIKLTNPSLEPGLFTIAADDFSDWFTIQPSEIRLEANESRAVKVQVKPNQSGRFATSLSVVGYPLDTRSFNAGSGLKLPVIIISTVPAVALRWFYVGLVMMA